jgi:hypothetical protein
LEIVTGQTVYYSNKNHLSLEDIAESLLALKAIIETTPDVLERLKPGLQIQKVSVFVNEIKSGSLLEDLIVKFLFGNQEKLESSVQSLRKDIDVDSLLSNRTLVGAIIGALITGGGIYLLNKLKGPEEQKQALQASQNVFIINGANLAGVTDEQFRSVIQGTIERNDHLPKEAVKVVRPAKREGQTSIVLNQDPQTTIGSQAIKAMPTSPPNDEPAETVDDFYNVEIQIRAIDLDSTKRGWAAVVPSISSRRTKMHIDPHIKVQNLLEKTTINGDITVIFRYDESGARVPNLIFLRELKK